MVVAGATLASTLIVARLLEPADFGLAALAITVPALLLALVINPISQALIRSGAVDMISNDRAFTLLAMLGVACLIFSVIAGLAMTYIYHAAPLLALSAVAGLDCVFMALAAVPMAILTRKLRMRALTLRTLGFKAASLFTTISLAFAGAGPWAIVGGLVAGSAASCLLLWRTQRRSPRFRMPRGLGDLLRTSAWISGEQGLSTITVRLFILIFARFHGLEALGYLNFAIRLVDEAGTLISSSISNVALAFFSAGARQGRDLTNLFLRGTHGIMLVAGPIFLGLAAVAPDLIPVVFSPKWHSAVPAVQIMALFWILRLSRMLGPALMRAVGNQKSLTFNAFVALVATMAALYVTRNAPLTIAVLAYGVRTLVTLPVGLRQIAKVTRATVGQQIGATLVPIACASVMAGTVLLLRATLFATMTPFIRLGLLVVIGVAVYALMVFLLDRRQVREMIFWWKQR
jgi:O-antigen/teichoic acid export membrane protein